MSHPTFIAKGTKGQGTGSSITFTYPANIQAGDLLVLYLTSVGLGAVPADASWDTAVVNGVYPTIGTGNVRMYLKTATGAETGNENVTRSGQTGTDTFMCQVYQFRSSVGIPDSESEGHVTTGGTDSTITYYPCSVNGVNRTLAGLIINYNGSQPTVPSGYTRVATDDDGSGTYLELITKEDVSSDGSVTASNGSSLGWHTIHMSIKTKGRSKSKIVLT